MKFCLLCIALLIFFSCCASENKKNDVPFEDIPLITYYDHYENDGFSGAEGYMNAETFEIVIPAQYRVALPFVGGYAIVQEYNGKTYIINKRNEVVFRNRNLQRAKLYKMEKNDSVFVLTKSDGGYSLKSSRSIFPTFEPTRKSFELYNVSTGRRVIREEDTRSSFHKDPIILLIDDYLIYDNKVYVLNNKGNLDECDISLEDIISSAAAARNMTYKEQDFHYYSEILFDPYFSYIDVLDLNVLLQHIPRNTRIIHSEGYDWRYKDNKPVYRISPINRKAVYPLQENFSLYAVDLEYNDKSGELTGLYNAIENKWVINPIETDCSFYETHYENYIGLSFFPHRRITSADIYGNIFYNINTRKAYSFIFTEQTNFNTFPYLVYIAHYKKEHIKRHGSYYGRDGSEMKIEDF